MLRCDYARGQSCDQLIELGSRYPGLAHLRCAVLIDAMHGEHILGEIDAKGQNSHGTPLPSELMRELHFPWWHSLPVCAKRMARDGEVPFIR